ncbi:hypothetical protein [Deinococcus cellulosilyticus]|uniref:Uncharacterized protein n=1 Tax=Deinococcus cellulosilyticus (strain DSM 18568 / NBRC 106333 / KACC 11606 / 5516J-15) TaxID=1223518 RepID=A0A511N7V4_DEIC1|nr:hypothetical protein [Deinococcus cellulosilyticus]GEM48919.1 hypothetical protein DC3_45540 [Deinococcus cellulosilyticus NBRC 106333 = KACC 11606]
MGYSIQLRSGHQIELSSYHQDLTDQERLAGLLTREDNLQTLQMLRQAQDDLPVLLLEPEQTRLDTDFSASFGEVSSMPPVLCVSTWVGEAHAGSEADYSALKIIWFQGAFGLPDPQIAAQLEELDWVKHSKCFVW